MEKDSSLIKHQPRPLPKIDDLYNDVYKASEINDLNRLLNKPPKKEWLRTHPLYNNEYLPIGIIEYLATSIFLKTRTEVKEVQLIANSVQVTVRVWVLDPVTGEWDWQDGVGAAPLRTKKGANASDYSNLLDSSVQTATPAAKTYAEKDAYEKFGKLFGRDLNRSEDNLLSYNTLDTRFEGVETGVPEELKKVIETSDREGLLNIWASSPEYRLLPEFMTLITNRKKVLDAGNTPGKQDLFD